MSTTGKQRDYLLPKVNRYKKVKGKIFILCKDLWTYLQKADELLQWVQQVNNVVTCYRK